VDKDGNETSGIRLPDQVTPLATYTGWNLRDPTIGAPDAMFDMVGSMIPFARTRAEREKSGDPRPSIQERYASREEYLRKVEAAAQPLVRQGLMLQTDVAKFVEKASARWDMLTGSGGTRQADGCFKVTASVDRTQYVTKPRHLKPSSGSR
jgi:hypothetical protein